jgi:hypothetical protein
VAEDKRSRLSNLVRELWLDPSGDTTCEEVGGVGDGRSPLIITGLK